MIVAFANQDMPHFGQASGLIGRRVGVPASRNPSSDTSQLRGSMRTEKGFGARPGRPRSTEKRNDAVPKFRECQWHRSAYGLHLPQHITVDTPSTAGILELDDSMVSSRQLFRRRKCAC